MQVRALCAGVSGLAGRTWIVLDSSKLAHGAGLKRAVGLCYRSDLDEGLDDDREGGRILDPFRSARKGVCMHEAFGLCLQFYAAAHSAAFQTMPAHQPHAVVDVAAQSHSGR